MNRRARVSNAVALTAVRGAAGLLLAVLAWIVAYSLAAGWNEITQVHFYTHSPITTGAGSGVAPQLFNTAYLLVLTLLLTIPTGLAAGIYFAEYAGTGRLVNAVRRATETLATLPSIVVGLFGYSLFVQAVHAQPSRLAAALALTVIGLPYAIRVTEDALRALPPVLREGALALGATRWQAITRTLLRAALPSLITGMILIAGRVFGEAAAVLFTGTAGTPTPHPNFGLSPFETGDTLAVNLYLFRSQVQVSDVPDVNLYTAGVAALLILLVLVFNVAARVTGRLAVRRLGGRT